MIKTNFLIALLILLVESGCGGSGSAGFDLATETAIDAAVSAELVSYGGREGIPGAIVGVWAPERGSYVKALGIADRDAQVPMNLYDRLRVGSNTKTFVITVVLQLVDEGRMSLDDTLSRFDIGVEMPNAERITVRQLANMTSGLAEYLQSPELPSSFTPETYFDPHYLATIASHLPPLSAPGERWNYSNTNYLMLGLIVEAVTRSRVEDEIIRRLLVPMKLTSTVFPTVDPNMAEPYMHGYSLDENRYWVDRSVYFPPSLTWTAGAMVSDMTDLKHWVKAYVSGTTNSAASQQERLTCIPAWSANMEYYGLGVACTGGWFGYTGSIEGYNSAVYYLPERDSTLIVLVNSQQENPWPGVANAIAREVSRLIFPDNVLYKDR